MDEEIITFADIQCRKEKFYHYKSSIFLEDENTDKYLTRVLLIGKI